MKAFSRGLLAAVVGLFTVSLGVTPATAATDEVKPDGHIEVLIPQYSWSSMTIGEAAKFAAKRCGGTVGEYARIASEVDRTGEWKLICAIPVNHYIRYETTYFAQN